jgi:type IV pilus assembly protein PilW
VQGNGDKFSGENKEMKTGGTFKEKGVTLIELLVTLVICTIVVAGIYRVFIAQSKAYSVQDQVAEVQQTVRGAMEILLRDLRMAGFDDDSLTSTVAITEPIAIPVAASSITVSYEYYDKATLQYQRITAAYWRDAPSSRLIRQVTINAVGGPQEILLENVDAFNLAYGVDEDEDGAMDDRDGDGTMSEVDWVSPENVGVLKVVALRVTLTGRPEKVDANDDRFKTVTPRTLVTAVTLRNLCYMK